MLTELREYGKSIREEIKATLSEIKTNAQGTSSEEKEVRIQINHLEHKEEVNSQSVQNEDIRIQKKNKERTRFEHLQMCQHLNHRDTRRRRGGARN